MCRAFGVHFFLAHPVGYHARAFLFHSQTAKDIYLISSMIYERLTSLALIHVGLHAQTTPVEPVEVVDKFALTGPQFLALGCHVLSCCLFLFIAVYACYEL